MSAHKIEDFFPKQSGHRKEPSRNSYLVQYDGKTAVFRTPRWRMVLGVSVGTFLIVLSMLPIALSIERWGTVDFPILTSGLPLTLLGLAFALLSGSNEITFNLDTRMYKRVLLGPGIQPSRNKDNIIGTGNLLQRRIIDGDMNEILGTQIAERQVDMAVCMPCG